MSGTVALTEEQQERRRLWYRRHVEEGVAFNAQVGMAVRRWDPDGVEVVLPYAEHLSAHAGVIHGGLVSALIDTAGCGAVMAGHDYNKGSRMTTVSMTVHFMATAPGEDLVAYGRCTRRGRKLNFADVEVRSATTDTAVAQGMLSVQVSGDRAGAGE